MIGLDFYYSLVSGRIKKGLPSDPVATETVFGWIICGPTFKTKTNTLPLQIIQLVIQ